MKLQTGIALGIAAGYLLGRTKKMKLAIFVGATVAGKRLPGVSNEFALQLIQRVLSAEEIKRLTDLRDQALDAGRSAVTSLAQDQMNVLTDRLQERTERIKAPLSAAGQDQAKAADTAAKGTARSAAKAKSATRTGRGRQPADPGKK